MKTDCANRDITIAIGAVTVMPDQWLPRIFGSEADEPMPEFPSLKVVKRVIDLIMRLYSSVIMAFEIALQDLARASPPAKSKGRATLSSMNGAAGSCRAFA